MIRERDIEKQLTRRVKDAGGLSYKWDSPGSEGVPDRIIIMPGGKIYFVELKTTTGRLSHMQKWQHTRLKNKQCSVYTVYGQAGLDLFMKDIMEDLTDDDKG